MRNLIVEVHPFKAKLTLLHDSNCFLIASTVSVYSLQLVLATVPNSPVGSGTSSDLESNRCNGSYHTKTQTIVIGPVLSTKNSAFQHHIFGTN